MLYSVSSKNNSDTYNTVTLNMDIPWKCPFVKYYVSTLNTNSNILMTTTDDYILVKTAKDTHITRFDDKFTYSVKTLSQKINELKDLTFEYDKEKRKFTIKANIAISIEAVTHRVQLLLGMYNEKFPLKLKANETYTCPDIPIFSHTKLYLVSIQGQAIHSNLGEQEYTPSVLADINTMTIDGKPFIYDFDQQGKPIKTKINTDSLKYLEIRLVDFKFQPIILRSPLFLTIKVKPAKEADIRDVLTK